MSNKYGGQLIYSTRDNYGPIEVIDYKQTLRSLHFGNTTQQTGMFLYNPNILIHKYTQAMLTSLCWHTPEKILILGLGAGSIAKYLLHFLPDSRIDAVELRPEVARIAEEYFSLPLDDVRLSVDYCLAEEFLSQKKDTIYDLIIVDLFLTENRKDITVNIHSHILELKELLSTNGCICINIIGSEYINYSGLNELRKIFKYDIYIIPVKLSNVILLITTKGIPADKYKIDFTTMEKKFGLPFRQYFNLIKVA